MGDIRNFSLFQFLILSLASCKSVWHRQVNRNIRSIVFRRCRSPNHRPSRLNNNNNSQRAYDLIEGEKRSIKDHCWREREDKAGSLEVALMDSLFFSLTSVYSIHYRYGRPDWSLPPAPEDFSPLMESRRNFVHGPKKTTRPTCVLSTYSHFGAFNRICHPVRRVFHCVSTYCRHTHTLDGPRERILRAIKDGRRGRILGQPTTEERNDKEQMAIEEQLRFV